MLLVFEHDLAITHINNNSKSFNRDVQVGEDITSTLKTLLDQRPDSYNIGAGSRETINSTVRPLV